MTSKADRRRHGYLKPGWFMACAAIGVGSLIFWTFLVWGIAQVVGAIVGLLAH